jgi:CheY-like chemotaxis protein
MYKKILLIDDDADEQFFFMEALKEIKAPVKFFFANNPKEGVRLAKFLLPDFIFIDINMPAISGFECLESILVNTSIQKPNVIIYSTGVDEMMHKKAIKKGATACIRKQPSIRELTATLEDLLQGALDGSHP